MFSYLKYENGREISIIVLQLKGNTMIRLISLKLENFKNVENGTVPLSSWKPGGQLSGSDIVGLYGQNGSGKTSVIQALSILKKILTWESIEDEINDCVSRTAKQSILQFDGVLFTKGGDAKALFSYVLSIGSDVGASRVVGEKIAYKDLSAKKPAYRTLFEYERKQDDSPFLLYPKKTWVPTLRIDDTFKMSMLVADQIAVEGCCSLLFSSKVLELLARISELGDEGLSKAAAEAKRETIVVLTKVVGQLIVFGHTHLAIVSAAQQGEGMANRLRISTHEGDFGVFADNGFNVNLTKPTLLTEQNFSILKRTVDSIGPVLGALVPGLRLGVRELDKQLDDDGALNVRAEIVCTRGEIVIPLRRESEGIKKLVSILVLLIDVYSKPEACVAIDEFDSGVFEFLLGEILQVLQDQGHGQLIFTAHNLRPLEIVDKGSLVFTTSNPRNRYVSFKGNRDSNNLRSQYIRAINLGGQPEVVYEPTNKFDIDSAFFEAGLAAREGDDGHYA